MNSFLQTYKSLLNLSILLNHRDTLSSSKRGNAPVYGVFPSSLKKHDPDEDVLAYLVISKRRGWWSKETQEYDTCSPQLFLKQDTSLGMALLPRKKHIRIVQCLARDRSCLNGSIRGHCLSISVMKTHPLSFSTRLVEEAT